MKLVKLIPLSVCARERNEMFNDVVLSTHNHVTLDKM